jgi:hypothetical protein
MMYVSANEKAVSLNLHRYTPGAAATGAAVEEKVTCEKVSGVDFIFICARDSRR